jgi:NAD(P)-dependent dehydrogenase (short-subunit alcohol dehydrogenase family)
MRTCRLLYTRTLDGVRDAFSLVAGYPQQRRSGALQDGANAQRPALARLSSEVTPEHLKANPNPSIPMKNRLAGIDEELPFPGFASYCASKGGVKMLTRDLAIELVPHKITVNGVASGAIATPINAELFQDPPKLEALLSKIPLRRMGAPEDVAGVVAFLASADADYITATTLLVDGGLMWNYQEQ